MSEYPRITELPDGDVVYSHDGEEFQADTLGELLDSCAGMSDVCAGRVIYVGDRDQPDCEDIVDASAVYMGMIDTAQRWGGGWADGYPNASDEALAELQGLLAAWLEKHAGSPQFWRATNVREYVLTQADIDGRNA